MHPRWGLSEERLCTLVGSMQQAARLRKLLGYYSEAAWLLHPEGLHPKGCTHVGSCSTECSDDLHGFVEYCRDNAVA